MNAEQGYRNAMLKQPYVTDGQGVSTEVRPEVAEFAVAMELKLRKNDHKTGWRDQPIEAHIKLLRIEMMELDVALDHLGDEEAMKECVDVANFAMIIRDKLKQQITAEQLSGRFLGKRNAEDIPIYCAHEHCPDETRCRAGCADQIPGMPRGSAT